jgi:ATP/maltotriose-dependent transcriptional regulator MalT
MADTDLCGWVGQSHHESWPVSALVVLKLRCPPVWPGMVRRTSLIDRLARHYSDPIVSVIVLPGYGKTTLPAEWAERAARRR